MIELNKIFCETNLETMSRMPDGFIDNCITSPPYFGLRSYLDNGHDDKHLEIGLEETPELYVSKLVEVFTEVKRVMKTDGTLWIVIGDSYASQGGGQVEQTVRNSDDFVNAGQNQGLSRKAPKGLKPKDLIGIPWMLAFALRNSGWYLRQDCIWAKPNPMPESVTDRCTKAHEYIFLLSKSSKYYYDADAIRDPLSNATLERNQYSRLNGSKIELDDLQAYSAYQRNGRDEPLPNPNGANKRSVWTVTTQPYKEAHFAVFPEELIEPCVLTTKPDAIIYDPFGGSGTVGVVVLRARRRFILSELSAEYCKIADKRLLPYLQPMLF